MNSDKQEIVTEALSKQYGYFAALDGLSITVPEGTCMGFLGPNGSGKSTTIKLLTGLATATSGSASIFGYEIGKETRRALLNVGSVVETPVFPPFLSCQTFDLHVRLKNKEISDMS